MKALFINLFEKTVELIDHPGDLISMYASLQCEIVEMVRLPDDNVI